MVLKERQPAWPFPKTDTFPMPAKPTTQPRARFEHENAFYQTLILLRFASPWGKSAYLVKHPPIEFSTPFFPVEFMPSGFSDTRIM